MVYEELITTKNWGGGGVVAFISSPSYTLNKQQPSADSIRDLLIPQEVTIRPFNQWIFQVPVKGGRDYITP